MTSREQHQLDLIIKHAGKPGLRGKIDAKCIECIFDPYQRGSWRSQVEKCTCTSCPVHDIRVRTLAGKSSRQEIVEEQLAFYGLDID